MEQFTKNTKEQLKTEIENLSSDRIEFKLSLRKKKFNSLLAKKRNYPSLPNSSENSYELFLSNIVIPENCKIIYSDNDELISNALNCMKAEDITTAKYGICQIKTYLSYFIDDDTLNFNLNLNFISDLLNLIEKWGERKEKQLVYNILYIMTNYSFINTNTTIAKLLLASKGYKIWDLCFDMQDYEIMSQLVWTLSNFIYCDKESSYNLLKSYFFQKKIYNFYSNPTIVRHLNETNKKNIFYIIIERGITLLTNLLSSDYLSSYNKEERYKLSKPVLGLILKYSETNSSEIFLACVYSINIAIDSEPRLIDLLDNSNIFNIILNKKFFSDEKIVLHCNRIIGEYCCFKSGMSQDFYDKCTNYEIDILFGMKSNLVIKEVFWALSNIIHDNIKSAKNLSENDPFLDKILYLYKNPIKFEYIDTICYFFLTFIPINNLYTFFKLINKGLLDITLEHTKNTFDKPKNLKNILELIEMCLYYGNLGENEFVKTNEIKEKCEFFGLRDLLRKYEDSEDEEISNIVEKIITDYFE